MSASRWFCLLAQAVWLMLAGCAGDVPETSAPTASLAGFSSATPTRTATPWVATPFETVELEPSPTPFVHIVAKGDTLLGIAIKYGVQLDQLLAANPDIDPHFLSVGQSLRIPGPNGEPVQSLLPTSTPMPLTLSTARCFPTPSERLICLITVSNPGDSAVEAVSVQVTLLDAAGTTLDSQLAYAPLNLLPAGTQMPVTVSFDQPGSAQAGAQPELRSAVEAQTPADRYLPADVEASDVTYSDDRRHASVEGTVNVSTASDVGDWREGLLAIAFDASGTVIGFAKWESGQDPIHEEQHAFSLDVYSLGPAIDHIDFMAEARLLTAISATPAP